ncbi:PL29 family lyase N-terminal domain-containing protein [Bacteroides ilei]|uniref:PL29 family lyase N-terminal domain-containing protein n=1 Tax=Bacteroides ilei TaxID=1907658 RepID=UPI0009FAEA29|nr:PL29 family lyase N-terminal domain-containing protein [Bacteroides ilei]
MRKKYLSALLFGALLFASAGTFTSCKDYDDDINNLQNQITANADAIKALQELVNSGKYVTAVSGNENVITFTFTDGTTQQVTVETAEQEAQTVTIGEDGEVIINGEGTGFYTTKTPTEAEVEAGLIKKGANGTWEVLGENGEYTDTKIPVSGVTVSGSEAEGYTFTIVNANGESQTVKLPSAASAITSIDAELIGNKIDGQATPQDETIDINQYAFDAKTNKDRWEKLTGATVTSNEVILTSAAKIASRINPVSADATLVDFSLTNSKNETLPGIIFEANEYKDYVTSGNIDSRAGYGNGLYTLSMKPLEVKNEDAVTDDYKSILTSGSHSILYALNAQNACRGKYQFAVSLASATADFSSYTIDDDETNLVKLGNPTLISNETKAYTYSETSYSQKVDAKVAHSVAVTDDMSEIYDMWLTAEDYDVDLFNLTFDQEKHTFTINADPDIITKADFILTVHTLDNNGIYRAQPIKIAVSNKIVADAEYAVRELTIVEDNTDDIKNKNAFFADMKTMTDGIGDQLAAWQRKVDATKVKFYTDADCKTEVTGADGIDLVFVNADRNKEVAIKDAADMKFVVTNKDASQHFSVDKVYYAQVTFLGGTDELNTIVVPFEFSIPELSTLFAIRDGYVVDGVINAYFYNDGTAENIGTAGTNGTASAAVELERYFSKYVADANVEVTGKIGNDDCTKLFKWGNTTATNGKYHFADVDNDGKLTEATTLELVDGIKDGKPAKAYGEAVTVKVTKDNYYTWKYVADGADEYSFQIRLMSPVYEGSIAVLTGERVIVNANDFVAGANITEKDIEGRDYNNNNLYIFPDVASTQNEWKNKQIKNVTPSVDKDHYINSATMTNAWNDGDGVLHKGTINIKGRSLSNDTDIDLPVKITDAWGYELDVTIPVTVKASK